MSLIHVNHLTFSYEGSYDTIFDDISFQIDTDWKLGFIGRNGRGKTTFLRLLMGEEGYEGQIFSSVEFAYFPYEVKNTDDMALDVAEQIIGQYEYWQLSREIHLLELDEQVLYRPYKSLSQGERTKLLLAALFLREDRFLLIDEPTNHLDVHGRELVSRYLSKKKGFILVSHDRSFLDRCIDHVLCLNRSTITVEKGNFTSWQQNAELRQAHEMSENERLKRDIKRLKAAAERTAAWSDKIEKTKNGVQGCGLKPDKGHVGAQAAKMMKKSKNAEKRQSRAIEEKAALLKDTENMYELKLSPLAYKGNRLIAADQLTLYYGETKVCGPLTFSVNQGDRIALWGPNGSGKSSLLKLIAQNERIHYEGNFILGSRIKISYVSQDTSCLRGDLKAFCSARQIDESLLKAILRKLDFERIQFEKPIESFSQGQKKKVLIGASLCEQAHIYVWDEPLNYIDVISRMQIEALLEKYKPTMIFAEHDQAFCKKIADHVLCLDPIAGE